MTVKSAMSEPAQAASSLITELRVLRSSSDPFFGCENTCTSEPDELKHLIARRDLRSVLLSALRSE